MNLLNFLGSVWCCDGWVIMVFLLGKLFGMGFFVLNLEFIGNVVGFVLQLLGVLVKFIVGLGVIIGVCC